MAWKKLYDRYDPWTPARALQAMIAVMWPDEIVEGKKIRRAIDEWQMKLSVFKRDFAEEVLTSMKLAIGAEPCPRTAPISQFDDPN